MNITITRDASPRYSSKYESVYAEVERALDEGQEDIILNIPDMKKALLLTLYIRRRFDARAYVCFTKYGYNGVIQPKITISPRAG